MKWLHVPLENEEYEKLKKVKGKRQWWDFIMELLKE